MKTMIRGGFIAAIYVILVWVLQPVSFSFVQFRAAEALTLLPMLMPEAIGGLYVGVLLANFLGGLGPWDVFGGSLVTLLAAYLTWRFRTKPWIAYASPIILNAFLISLYLKFIYQLPYWLMVISIGLSEAVVVLALGIPLVRFLAKNFPQIQENRQARKE